MFERRTVFIVGAGASYEVNLPLGHELKRIIATKLNFEWSDGWKRTSGDGKVFAAIQHYMREKGERDANPYCAAGRAIAAGMIQAISIDNYLHAHADDELVTLMGKLGIAASILEAERRSKLAINCERDTVNLSAVSDTWYALFFQMLKEGIQRSTLDNIFDNVAFITFNYDRCIEHYLMYAIANYFRIEPTKAQDLVRQLPIEHPYGQVGRLPWQDPRGSISFGKEYYGKELPDIAGQIRTFTEGVEDGDMLQRARKLITEAEVVVFLGFSYGKMNMKLLSVDLAGPKAVFGTSHGISTPNKRVIEQDIVNSIGLDLDAANLPEFADMKCAEFLDAYWKPIIRGI